MLGRGPLGNALALKLKAKMGFIRCFVTWFKCLSLQDRSFSIQNRYECGVTNKDKKLASWQFKICQLLSPSLPDKIAIHYFSKPLQ